MWTKFDDMHSGGYKQTDFDEIWIELPENKACEYFEKIFDFSPYGVTCDCCGSDYWINEEPECPISASTANILIIRKEEL